MFALSLLFSHWIMNCSLLTGRMVLRTFGVGIDSVRFLTIGFLTHLQAAIPDALCPGAT